MYTLNIIFEGLNPHMVKGLKCDSYGLSHARVATLSCAYEINLDFVIRKN